MPARSWSGLSAVWRLRTVCCARHERASLVVVRRGRGSQYLEEFECPE